MATCNWHSGEFSFYRYRFNLCSLIHSAFLSDWGSRYSLASPLIGAERNTQLKESSWQRQWSAVPVWSAVVRDDNASLRMLRLPCSWLFPFFCSFFSPDSSACLMSAGVYWLCVFCKAAFLSLFSCLPVPSLSPINSYIITGIDTLIYIYMYIYVGACSKLRNKQNMLTKKHTSNVIF